MKKALIVTTNISFFGFLKNDLEILNSKGYEIHIATNKKLKDVNMTFDVPVKVHDIGFSRSPLSFANIEAFRHLYALINHYDFDIIHCHTPVAAALTRFAAKKARDRGTKVIYTAHGFHFYKGAPLKMWLMFYPVEKLLSGLTDTIITINTEDYDRAYNRFNTNIRYVHGVGVNVKDYKDFNVNTFNIREELNILSTDIAMLSVGELNSNKNHETVIRALDVLINEMGHKNLHYFIAGDGVLKPELKRLIKNLCLGDNVHLLGYREDIKDLMKATDIYLLPSYREGLNVSLMEAMASGMPAIVSDIRGNKDLIDKNGGVRVAPGDVNSWVAAIIDLISNTNLKKMGQHNQRVIEDYSNEKVYSEMLYIYQAVDNDIH